MKVTPENMRKCGMPEHLIKECDEYLTQESLVGFEMSDFIQKAKSLKWLYLCWSAFGMTEDIRMAFAGTCREELKKYYDATPKQHTETCRPCLVEDDRAACVAQQVYRNPDMVDPTVELKNWATGWIAEMIVGLPNMESRVEVEEKIRGTIVPIYLKRKSVRDFNMSEIVGKQFYILTGKILTETGRRNDHALFSVVTIRDALQRSVDRITFTYDPFDNVPGDGKSSVSGTNLQDLFEKNEETDALVLELNQQGVGYHNLSNEEKSSWNKKHKNKIDALSRHAATLENHQKN